MSDIFEQDIDDETEDLSSLEDSDVDASEQLDSPTFVPLDGLYLAKLNYSSEGIFVKVPTGRQSAGFHPFRVRFIWWTYLYGG